ncbi:hypothetical protein RhiirA4_487164 [Rhizophagus irregularis]|uniref:Uncharacterized protein n=1 Tax=Rhizophagus irregularis TaxID=588596 RepID=A0A2I1HS87_9GLOM|nr:hypothetical protein RhiirA4_487164 [Rhizophagus irregularis]
MKQGIKLIDKKFVHAKHLYYENLNKNNKTQIMKRKTNWTVFTSSQSNVKDKCHFFSKFSADNINQSSLM